MKLRDRIKELRRVPAGELRPNPRNWRTHPKEQQDALRGVLAEVGIADAVLARELPDGTLELIDGHLRAETMPDQEIPCLVLDVDEYEAGKILATLDPLAGMAGADPALLDELLRDVQTSSEAVAGLLEDLAKDAGILDAPAELAEGEVPELPADPETQPGDLWLMGEHRLLCGNATCESDVNRLLFGKERGKEPGKTPFILVTDPPYGVDYDPKWRHEAGINNSKRVGKVENDDRADWTEAYSLFPGRVAYVWHAGRYCGTIADHLEAAGLGVRAQIVWRKQQFAIGRGHYHWQHEPCWYAVRPGGSARWCGDRTQSTVWDITSILQNDEEKVVHGTQKPVECMGRPIRNHGEKDDAVYDPFVGSGTTIVAAEQLGRTCFAMEIDPAYCDVAVGRWETLTGDKARRE